MSNDEFVVPIAPADERVALPRRRMLIAGLTALASGCAADPFRASGAQAMPAPADVAVRPPAVGQRWIYRVRNVFSDTFVDQVTETVETVAPAVRIRRVGSARGPLEYEVQSPWGMIVEDPHWDPPIRFAEALPAWPRELQSSGVVEIHDSYGLWDEKSFPWSWDVRMTTRGWETLRVPAGSFTALGFESEIAFASYDFSRMENRRTDAVWFVPRIGRWARRRSSGTYFIEGRGGDSYEDFLEWELIDWS